MPKISIIIPLYNKEKEIENTIMSVLSQEYTDFELIVVNDGTTDRSLDIVEHNIKDDRIRVVTQPNAGVSAARNRGISEAKGEFVLLLDADDTLSSGAMDIIECAENIDVLVGSFVQTDAKGGVVSRHLNLCSGLIDDVFQAYWKQKFFLRMGNFFVRRQYLDNIDPFRTDISLYEDLEWLLRLITNARVYVTKQIILEYSRGESGLSRGFRPIEKDYAKIASVKNVADRYKQKVIGDFVFRRFYSRLRYHDADALKNIWSNNAGHLLFCLHSCLVSYFKSKITQKNIFKKYTEGGNVLPGLSDSQLQIRRFINNLRTRYMLDYKYQFVCWGGVNLSSGYPVVPKFGHLIKMRPLVIGFSLVPTVVSSVILSLKTPSSLLVMCPLLARMII